MMGLQAYIIAAQPKPLQCLSNTHSWSSYIPVPYYVAVKSIVKFLSLHTMYTCSLPRRGEQRRGTRKMIGCLVQ